MDASRRQRGLERYPRQTVWGQTFICHLQGDFYAIEDPVVIHLQHL